MKKVKLGKIADVNWGDTSVTKASYVDDGYTAYSATGPDGKLSYFDYDREAIVLSAIGARCGKTWFVSGKWSSIKNTIRFWSESEELDNRYLFWATVNPDFWPRRGAAQPFITIGDARNVEIPLPPLAEQKRIAAILDQADALHKARRRAIERLNDLSQSIFYEMFGDPVTNPKGWNNNIELGDVAEIVSGITKGRKVNGEKTREVPYMAVANVQDKALNLGVIKFIEATESEILRYRLQKDDLLLTEGGDPDKLGRGTLWNNEIPESIHQNHIFRVRLKSTDVDPVFLNWIIGSNRGKQYFLRSAKQTTGIASINMTQLRGFPLLIPPLELQKEFKTRISRLDSIKSSYNASLAEVESLFSSLQQQAFRGELSGVREMAEL